MSMLKNAMEDAVMEKIKRFVECLIPVTACNLQCSYCYVIQRHNRKNRMAELKYTPEQIAKAMKKDRWGGTCYFSICGAGETILQIGLEDIIYSILSNGHYVNITTNGTVTKRLQDILTCNKEYASRLHFSFSFHYLELKRLNLMERFFDGVNLVREAGASFVVMINLSDEYVPYLEDIKKICVEKVGAMPQVAATRKEETGLQEIELLTRYSVAKYNELGESFNSPLFEFTMKNFNIKRKEFCYAGDWTAILDLSTGIMRRCYSSYIYQDVFKKPIEKIRFFAMGNCCGSPFCMNSSHFMSLGVIPELETSTYAELRNRKEADWYTEKMDMFLSGKLCENNKEYGWLMRRSSDVLGICDGMVRKMYRAIKKIKVGKR